jgi:hypothetical protein
LTAYERWSISSLHSFALSIKLDDMDNRSSLLILTQPWLAGLHYLFETQSAPRGPFMKSMGLADRAVSCPKRIGLPITCKEGMPFMVKESLR